MSSPINLYAPEVWSNPYPVYAQLRREAPVSQVAGGMWAVARYDDALHVLRNPQLFASEGFRAATQPPWLGRRNPVTDSILVRDPPDHTRLRALITRAFGPSSINRLEPTLRSLSHSLTSGLLERREVDFIESFALPLPAGVMAEVLGLDASLAPRFKQWSDVVVSIGLTSPEDTARHAHTHATLEQMEQYLGEVVERRRRQPGDDLVSDLLRSRVDGEALSQAELMGFLVLLLLAGLETTMDLLGLCALVLADRPALLARLRADRSLIPRFVEEVLRYESPSQLTLRMTTGETRLGGVQLPRGAVLLVLLGSANRDEAYFPDPDSFDLDRPQSKGLMFGHGSHFCLGAQLARLEARVALEVLLERCGGLTRPPGSLEWTPAVTTRGPLRLPLIVHPA